MADLEMADATAPHVMPGDSFTAEMFDLLWGQERGFVPTAVDHAYEMIWRQLITTGGQGGQRLSDVALAARLGVSRTPVRQALYRLAQDGLVHADPRRGFWVRTFTVQDITEIYELRAHLEALALRLAAPRVGAADIAAQLEELYQARARLPDLPVTAFMSCDLRLHNLIIHASGNSRLIRVLATLRSQHGLFQVRDSTYDRSMEIALDEHERVLLSLAGGCVDDAVTHMIAHIAHARARVLTHLFGVLESESQPAQDRTES